jgi:hypothetical protein
MMCTYVLVYRTGLIRGRGTEILTLSVEKVVIDIE